MSEDRKGIESRRRFLKLVGGSAVLAPLAGLSACSGSGESSSSAPAPAGDSTPSPSTPKPAAEQAAPAPEPTPAPQAADSSGMPKVDPGSPQARALAYVHDATTVDSSAQSRYQPGQACSNCALYTGNAGDEWGGCPLFQGKQVKATGWCSAYAPKGG